MGRAGDCDLPPEGQWATRGIVNLFISLSFLMDITDSNMGREDFRWGYPWRLEDANTAFLAAWESTIFFSTASRATKGMQ